MRFWALIALISALISFSVSPKSHIRKFDFLSKKQNVTGLQLADLIAYPITQYLLNPNRVNFAYDIIKDNIYVSDGKKLGLKVIPRLEEGL